MLARCSLTFDQRGRFSREAQRRSERGIRGRARSSSIKCATRSECGTIAGGRRLPDVAWIRRFIVFHHNTHPATMGAPEIAAFLSWLATDQRVSSLTQNQALSACCFRMVGTTMAYLRVLNRGRLGVRSPFDRLQIAGRALATSTAANGGGVPHPLSCQPLHRRRSCRVRSVAVHPAFAAAGCAEAQTWQPTTASPRHRRLASP